MKIKAIALAIASMAASAHAQITEPRETIAYDGARQIVDTCMTMAHAKHWPIAIWVLDIAGQPVYFASQGASEVGVTTAKFKAETALRTGLPSEQRAQSVATPVGQTVTEKIGLFPVAGGIPLMKDGKLIGSVGAGGGRPENGQSGDQICAQAGIHAGFKEAPETAPWPGGRVFRPPGWPRRGAGAPPPGQGPGRGRCRRSSGCAPGDRSGRT